MALFIITAFLAVSGTYGLAFRSKLSSADLLVDQLDDTDSDSYDDPKSTEIGCGGTYLQTYDESFRAQAVKQEKCEGERNQKYTSAFQEDLSGWKDVRAIYEVPTAEEAATWKKQVVVVSEGMWRMGVDGATHFYNIASMEVPNLAHFVLNPLKEAGKLDDTEIVIKKEHVGKSCYHQLKNARAEQALDAEMKQSTEAELKESTLPNFADMDALDAESKLTVTYHQLMKRCKSGIEIIPSIFPNVKISFKDGAPFCQRAGVCEAGDPESFGDDDTTILIIAMAKPLGWQWPFMRSPYCDLQRATSARSWVHSVTKKPEGEPDMITLIARGPDLGIHTDNYSYERPNSARISNWAEIEEAIAPWAKEKGLAIQKLVMEDIPFPDQIDMIRKTKIIIGHEGAGLSHMMYFEDPKKSGVVEIQDGEKPVEQIVRGEFPTMARNMGVPLAYLQFDCNLKNGQPNYNVDTKSLIAALEKLYPELGK